MYFTDRGIEELGERRGEEQVTLGDPAGFAVDWGWQRGLTVWALAGRRW